ncbi:hypothetical protein PHYPSEUDO_007846 [Phytophthora pseudosyringae]|uniref:DNA replication checkpoint mediator MRC1 domain-containing protein n=1 Tax=Phytophthora pseudosyringae TaxID=221518 RepID=A0A8T1VKW6_9STRA|nr:hypothetical protein PHYPSEUDO_007846 [Phytophthora pseudosyringae]
MSGEELALETQLLLQEATQMTQHAAVESVLDDAGALPPASEFEAAKSALLAKLRKKKEANRAQQQQLNQRRYGAQSTAAPQANEKSELFSPRKSRAQALKLPVAAATTSRKKQEMLSKLKTQAIQQGAKRKAKFFGYSSYEEQLKNLNRIEKMKILEGEKKDKEGGKKKEQDGHKEEQQDGEEEEVEAEAEDEDEDDPMDTSVEVEGDAEKPQEMVAVVTPLELSVDGQASPKASTPMKDVAPKETESGEREEQESVKVVRRRNRIQKHDVGAEEEDSNEADSEQDDKDDGDGDVNMEDATDAVQATKDTQEKEAEGEDEGDSPSKPAKSATPKDKAAGYRSLLRAEALQNRKRKRLVKGRGDNFVESEAEEDEDEDVLKIGGLGDFGFGVPQAKTQDSKEAEEERNALKLREDDLDHIVDDLSDDERAQEQDLEEMFRREQEDQDRQQVKEVMRNVKEGFGRNRRAFSGLHSGSEARGRFNLDELVAADGSKFEAARLGLLESDEELSEDDEGKKKKKITNADGEEEESEGEEEDEEIEMERMLRERFKNQPKIYVTSSESGSDNEEENEAKKDNGPDGDEVESDEERERLQMKLFSERARINRRMQRMKDLQRQVALENDEADPTVKSSGAMPNLLLEEDEDSQELMHMMNRTDVDSAPNSQTTTGSAQKKSRTDRPRPKLGRFNSYGGITSASRSSSSFSRVIGQCKLFSANSTGGSTATSKGFVFTSFSSDKAEDGGDENAVPNHDEAMPAERPELGKSKSWSGAKSASKRHGASGAADKANKKRKSAGGLFSVLSSYQCVSSTSQSQES